MEYRACNVEYMSCYVMRRRKLPLSFSFYSAIYIKRTETVNCVSVLLVMSVFLWGNVVGNIQLPFPFEVGCPIISPDICIRQEI